MERYIKEQRMNQIRNVAAYYSYYFRNAGTYIPEREYSSIPGAAYPDVISDGNIGHDDGHFTMNSSYLTLGYRGIAEICEKKSRETDGEEESLCLSETARIYREAAEYIRRHGEAAAERAEREEGDARSHYLKMADECFSLSQEPPRTFEEAVILFWFTWRIRSNIYTYTIGRLDLHLYPFYKADKEKGLIDDGETVRILSDLWGRINDTGSGDTLINIMLGGSDIDGNDTSNELSLLMMETHIRVKRSEPHINVRFHKNMTEEFYRAALRLQLLGHGQATVFYDDVIIPSLTEHGIALADAVNYCNDGCTEIIIDGRCDIDFFQMEALKALEFAMYNGEEPEHGELFSRKWSSAGPLRAVRTELEFGYRSGDVTEMRDFESVYGAVLDQYTYQLRRLMDKMEREKDERNLRAVGPLFVMGASPEFRESGRDTFRNPDVPIIQDAFLGSVPTVADCLAAIKKVVFEDGRCDMKTLVCALRADFEGYEPLRLRLRSAPKFGNNDDYVDGIAARFACDACRVVEEYNRENGRNILPSLLNFLFNDHAKIVGATPDGRRRGDPLCEHYSPTPGCAKNGPGATLLSASKGPLLRAIGDSPLYLSLPRNTVPENGDGIKVLDTLNKASMKLSLPILNIAVYDRDVLRRAQTEPEKYGDVIVRVWGYCARFVDLDRDMQEHIINRV